jgi:hypothetical protein
VSPLDRLRSSARFIWQHRNFLGCQPAQIRRSSTPAVLIKDANIVSLAREQHQDLLKGSPRALGTVNDFGEASPRGHGKLHGLFPPDRHAPGSPAPIGVFDAGRPSWRSSIPGHKFCA